MSRRPPLEAPVWLIERAATDDPPTVLATELLEQFARVGVVELMPTAGTSILDVADAERATGVGVGGPGFAFAEEFLEESARVAAALERLWAYVEQFDRLRTLRLAATDMQLVATTARALADRDGPARQFERVLETGLVVTYARPYLDSNKAGLGGRWRPESAEDRALHAVVIAELRDPYHAHADRTARRTLTDTAAMLGVDGPPTFREAWWRLTDDELAQLAELADRQAARFAAAADEIGVALGEQQGAAAVAARGERATLWFEGGIEAVAEKFRELREPDPGGEPPPA